MDPGEGGAVGDRHRHDRRRVAQLVVDLVGDLAVGAQLQGGVGAAGVGVVQLVLLRQLLRPLHRPLVVTIDPHQLGALLFDLGDAAGLIGDRDDDDGAQAGQSGRFRHRRAVVAAGRHRDGVEAAAQGVHHLGEGDAVLLGAGGIAALELQVELPQPALSLEVSRSRQRGVSHLGLEDVLEGRQSLLQRLGGIGRHLLVGGDARTGQRLARGRITGIDRCHGLRVHEHLGIRYPAARRLERTAPSMTDGSQRVTPRPQAARAEERLSKIGPRRLHRALEPPAGCAAGGGNRLEIAGRRQGLADLRAHPQDLAKEGLETPLKGFPALRRKSLGPRPQGIDRLLERAQLPVERLEATRLVRAQLVDWDPILGKPRRQAPPRPRSSRVRHGLPPGRLLAPAPSHPVGCRRRTPAWLHGKTLIPIGTE